MLALFVIFGCAGEAMASGSTIMGDAKKKVGNVFGSIKAIIFILGGFGLVGVAWGCIWGKINWKWFGALAVGLAIVAAAGSIVNYATGETVSELGNTFSAS
jgi:hypothetical protein